MSAEGSGSGSDEGPSGQNEFIASLMNPGAKEVQASMSDYERTVQRKKAKHEQKQGICNDLYRNAIE